ncbi:unnamed protein product [Candidula unifasciata]|uniref:Uncharacterized protein n=1 Tax=Candidula unifasciata TaxID=100452 RepID=A0A8S3ZCP6_9EUPU|nr:unnamed protein product [Candidula unifasciata]
MADTDQRNRVVFLGAGRVGKTAILKRFLFNTFTPDYKETVEDLFVRDYNIPMRRLSITTAHAFVLVYSITSQESFEEVKKLWAQIQEERTKYKVRSLCSREYPVTVEFLYNRQFGVFCHNHRIVKDVMFAQ